MKKMKLIAAGILTALCLTACGGQTEEAAPEAAQEETVQEVPEEEAEETAPAEEAPAEDTDAEATEEAPAEEDASAGLDNFDVDQEEVSAFAEQIKEAVAAKDLEALADLTAFPVYVGVSENGVVESRDEFLELGADAVITPELQEAVAGTDAEALSASMAGFTMMTEGVSGSITFGMTESGLAITGINY